MQITYQHQKAHEKYNFLVIKKLLIRCTVKKTDTDFFRKYMYKL